MFIIFLHYLKIQKQFKINQQKQFNLLTDNCLYVFCLAKVSSYEGNYFGDYHHIEFEDANGKRYDFGFGNNNFGDILLYFDDEQMNDNPKYLGKSFKIFWEWKISSFPCCSGEYESVEAYLPSITKLKLIETNANKK